MFYFWHTALIILFIAFAFFMGYRLGRNKPVESKQEVKAKCPMGFN